MPLQQIWKEYTGKTRDYNIRVRLSEIKWMFYFRIYQMNKWDEYPYENEVYRSKEYKDINKCEFDMHNFISTNYNIL